MTREILDGLIAFLDDQQSFIKDIENLTSDQLNWIPNGTKNSIGIIFEHLIGAKKMLIQQTIFNIEINRVREKEFETRNRSLTSLIKSYQDVSQEAKKLLIANIDDKNLFDVHDSFGGKRTTLDAIVHTIEHTSYHIGHIYSFLALLKSM